MAVEYVWSMPIYIKIIRGRGYYYEQCSVYVGPGLPPKTPTRYLGPVNPKRRKGALAGFIEANFKNEPGEVAAEQALRDYPPVPGETKPVANPVVPIDKPPTLTLHAPEPVPAVTNTLPEPDTAPQADSSPGADASSPSEKSDDSPSQ